MRFTDGFLVLFTEVAGRGVVHIDMTRIHIYMAYVQDGGDQTFENEENLYNFKCEGGGTQW